LNAGEYNGQRELNGRVEHKSAEFVKSVVLWTEGAERVPRIPHFRTSAMQRFERGERGGTEGTEKG
jgi:hypothetical protein